MRVELPISKSIANRLLIRRALRGDDVTDFVSSSMPDDVVVMAHCLSTDVCTEQPTYLDIKNCGTAMRFLTAYYAQKEGADVIIDGCERMHERPIEQEVSALRELGADIEYMQKEGYPPLHIRGCQLEEKTVRIDNPQSTQFISALLLIDAKAETTTESPYIAMTQQVVSRCPLSTNAAEWDIHIERDWSSAAFFYEWVALQEIGTECFFPGLSLRSLQGDSACARIFKHIGVESTEQDGGVRICKIGIAEPQPLLDMTQVPDLYPAIAVACHQLNIHPEWILPDSLQWKESNRIQSVRKGLETADAVKDKSPIINTFDDHRIAMAFAAAGYPVSETKSISKSFPNFLNQLGVIL